MTPTEQLIALLEEAPRLSLFVRSEVRFDKFDAYELVTAIRNDQVRIPRDQVGELVTALRAVGE
jgi:hypothetical protein